MTLGDKLRKGRFELDLTRKEMAELVGVNQKTIEKWENGGANIPLTKRQEVVNFYHIPMSDINKLCLELEETNERYKRVRKDLKDKNKQKAPIIDELPSSEIGDALLRDVGTRFVDVGPLEPIDYRDKDGKLRKFEIGRRIRF